MANSEIDAWLLAAVALVALLFFGLIFADLVEAALRAEAL